MNDRNTQNESALACAARQGDKEAVQLLLQRHWTWLKGLVYSVLADSRDLDDVLQDVCLRVITKIHTLREPERFRAWLAILARREALKHCRQRTQESSHFRGRSVSQEPDAYAEGPLDDVERKELCGHILDVVKTLPQKYREVFLLAHTGELSYAQIAEILDVPITTMQIRLVRARRMIQNQVLGRREHKVHER